MKRFTVLVMMFCLPFGVVHSATSQAVLTDVQAKLAIIHNFIGRYVQWPGRYALTHNSQIYVCSYGMDKVVESLNLLEKASTEELRVFVTHNPSLRSVDECHVIYIANNKKKSLPYILEAARMYPALTISPINRFAEKGGMVELQTDIQRQGAFEKRYIRYVINMKAMSRNKIKLEPDAVELAKEVLR